jgi:CheY-like chemotaxis protein
VPQPLVLAIEPDLRQAAIVKRIVREKVLADVVVVDSPDAALAAMRTTVPDVLLLSALLSPRDEDELVAHLRTLEGAEHLQTHTIPLLASALGPGEGRATRGLLAAFRRKKKPEPPPSGCDPDLFAEEIRVFIQRAADMKRERSNAPRAAATVRLTDAAAVREGAIPTPAQAGPASASCSSWASPFEWKPSSLIPDPESLIAHPESPIAHPEPPIARPESPIASPESEVAEPVMMAVAEEPVISVQSAEPMQASAPIAVLIQDSAPIQDPGSAIQDAGLAIQDQRLGMRDRSLGPLATWARRERSPSAAADSPDDLRALLGALAVPTAVVAVGYGRGCRIRRVRVPAAREPKVEESVGAVILSRRLLAEQRDRREQSRTSSA